MLPQLLRRNPQRTSRSGGGIGKPFGRFTDTTHPFHYRRPRWTRPLAGLSPRYARGRSERIGIPPCLSRYSSLPPTCEWRGERVVHSPLEAADRVCDDSQKSGTHLSLPSPPIRQYRQDYYRMHYPVGLSEEERLLPHTPWSTSVASSVLKRGAPTEVKVRVSQMKDWVMLPRAGLGVTNHLDWFLGSIWQILIGVDLGSEKSCDVTHFLTSSCVAVNQLAHIQARTLAANATVRREAFLDASVLHRPGAHFLRSQAIGCVDLLAGRGHEALRIASEEQRTALLFETTVGSTRRPMASATAGQSRPRSHAQRRRRGGFVATYPASARRRPNPTSR